MERWRWLPTTLGPRFVVVNIPAFQLYAASTPHTGALPPLTMPVIVGKAGRRATPVFSGEVRY